VKNTNLLWAQGLIYFPPIWPFKGSIVPSRTYAQVMRRERDELYMPPHEVEMVDAREKAGLFWECVALGRKMREKIVDSNQEHETAYQRRFSKIEDPGVRVAG
jgi:hypothetical protein